MLFKGEHSSLEKSFKLKKKEKKKIICAQNRVDTICFIHLVCGIVVNQEQQQLWEY